MNFLPSDISLSTTSKAILEVTTQSAIDLTSAEVLA